MTNWPTMWQLETKTATIAAVVAADDRAELDIVRDGKHLKCTSVAGENADEKNVGAEQMEIVNLISFLIVPVVVIVVVAAAVDVVVDCGGDDGGVAVAVAGNWE